MAPLARRPLGRLPVQRVEPLRNRRPTVPEQGPARTISRDGGKYPRWRGDGKELFFVSPAGTMMAVGFDATNGVSQGEPQPLFPTQIRVGDNRPYAVDKNGRFLLKIGPDPQFVVVMDWRTLVDR